MKSHEIKGILKYLSISYWRFRFSIKDDFTMHTMEIEKGSEIDILINGEDKEV